MNGSAQAARKGTTGADSPHVGFLAPGRQRPALRHPLQHAQRAPRLVAKAGPCRGCVAADGLDDQHTAKPRWRITAAQPFQPARRTQPELPPRWRKEQRRGMTSGNKAAFEKQLLDLAARIGTAEAERRGVAPRPKARAAGHDDQRPALGRQHAVRLVQKRQRMVRGFKPVQHRQPVDAVIGQRPARLVRQHRMVVAISRPVHHTLRRGHQPDDPCGVAQKRSQKRNGKAITRHRQPPRRAPARYDLIAHTLLRRTAKLRSVVEITQEMHIEMH